MILDGKALANDIKNKLKTTINRSKKRKPRLVIITVGDDPASKVYVNNKIKACDDVGITVTHYVFDKSSNKTEIIDYIKECNEDNNIDGIMVQLPLPKKFNSREIIDSISPEKDVDGLTTVNIGKLRTNQDCFVPCTAKGIVHILDYNMINLVGADVTIIGRSDIVGKPLADILTNRHATVTLCHSHSLDLKKFTKTSDIVICAIGSPKFITKDYFDSSRNTTVIDVGINRDENGKLCGDVCFNTGSNNDVNSVVTHITPVPGGVGPMTVAMLLVNTVQAWKNNN